MLGNLRPLLTRILNPIAKKLDINPNILTLISPIFAILSAILFVIILQQSVVVVTTPDIFHVSFKYLLYSEIATIYFSFLISI